MNEFYETLRDIRRATGLSQKDFATKIGMKPAAYNMVESGKNQPSYSLVSSIIDTFNLDANLLFGKGSASGGVRDQSVNDEKIKLALTRLANSSLLYLEFHLSDTLLNLKLLRESLTGRAFDRVAYEENQKKIGASIQDLKANLKTGQLTGESLLTGLVNLDESIRDYLDEIKDISKELYLNTPRK